MSLSKIIMLKPVYLIIAILLFTGCQEEGCRSTVLGEVQPAKVTVERMEKQLFSMDSLSQIEEFLQSNPVIAQRFFYEEEYPNRNILARRILGVIGDPYIDTLYKESVDAFEKNQSLVLEELGIAFSSIEQLFPAKTVPKIKTIVAGLYNDIVIQDDQVVIGLDFFIGEEATFRPVDYPKYILRRYNYNYLAPTVVKFFVNDLDKLGKENTLLSEMIDHGKVYFLLSQVMPCVADHRIIGFTEEEIEDVKANQEIIWAHLIENQLLYETQEFTKRKYLGERPNVYEIGENCPGRIGAWVGWEIVKNYMDRESVSIQELMADENHHDIFTASGYKPRNSR